MTSLDAIRNDNLNYIAKTLDYENLFFLGGSTSSKSHNNNATKCPGVVCALQVQSHRGS